MHLFGPLWALACRGVLSAPEPVDGPPLFVSVVDVDRSEVVGQELLFVAFVVDPHDSWALRVDSTGEILWSRHAAPGRRLVRAKRSVDGRAILLLENDAERQTASARIIRVPLDGGPETVFEVGNAHHDFLELADGDFAYLEHIFDEARFEQQAAAPIAADAVQLVSESSPRFDFLADYPADPFWACDHLQLGRWVPGYHEWSHANSLVEHPTDDAWLVVPRYFDALLKLDAQTGEVLWELGGRFSTFTLGPGAAFQHAHFSHAFDDRVLLFDNGDSHVSDNETSRVVELVLDEENGTADVAWEHAARDGAHTLFLGDARRLPGGNTLIAWGNQGRITEVTPEGDPVWELDVGMVAGRVSLW